MNSVAQPAGTSNAMRWIGRILTGLVVLFMGFDSIIKIIKIDPVVQSLAALGFPDSVARGIGALEVVITLLYLFPRTAVLGAVLLTGVMGGGIASHLRVGDPVFSHLLFGVYLGVLAWGGLWLRDPALRALMPVRRRS
ncbi:MAG TPA: DoxX family protein [Aliidongia sp.]|uniref:DoxX family protein n=1 Tax=Aliidongia sp. TaxID=1914230 RepID=UPI002DDCBDE5|nr:DoxX family protein [Aliidongia sp.]HEV2673103.1 DoxX family protein [Aliidongia sp.]